MADNVVSLTGNTTRDPELSFTAGGTAIAAFGLAINSRKKDTDGSWIDGDPQFFDIKAFGELAENIAESISKGTRVVINGRLNYSSWESKDDSGKRSKVEIIADSIGADLRWATAQVTRTERKG